MSTLEGKNILVAGGTSGVGLATAELLASQGAKVTVTGRDQKKLDNVSIAGVTPVRLDGADVAQMSEWLKGQPTFDHVVICVSGGAGAGAFADLDEDMLRSGFEAKFWPQFRTAQAVLPYVAETGSITFVGAASARTPMREVAGLAAINGAIHAMVEPLALELAPKRINAVSPGVIDTPWWNAVPEEQRAQIFEFMASAVPVNRIGKPQDVAGAIMFLIENSFMTGSIIDCDGGLRIK